MGVCASKPATKHDSQQAHTQTPASPATASPAQPRRATMEQKEAVAGATEQAKDAVQQAGQQVQSQVKELELMQKEIERLREAPVSVSEDAQNQSRIRQLEHEVLRVRQEINVALEIAEQEVKEAVLTAQASLRSTEGDKYADSQTPSGTQLGSNSAVASTDVYAPGPVSQHVSGLNEAPSSGGVYSQDPHGALADETISVDSAPHSIGANRAVLAGSSFADSDVSADRQAYFGTDAHDTAHDYSRLGTSTATTADGGGMTSYRPRVQLSSTPILGGEGTFGAQPLAYASPPAQQQQPTPAAVNSHLSQEQSPLTAPPSNSSQGLYGPSVAPSSVQNQGRHLPAGAQPAPAAAPSDFSHQQQQYAPATALSDLQQPQGLYAPSDSSQGQNAPASYSRLGQSGSRQMAGSSAIGIGRSSEGSDALQKGRAEYADSGLQDERSLRSFFSSGRNSPDFYSNSIGRSSPDHQGSGSIYQGSAPGPSQDGVRGSRDDGQAEDLVSDVHLRAQSASDAAVAAGQEQQQKLQQMMGHGMGPMQGPLHEGVAGPPSWMSKVHDQLYRNVHRHTMQPLHTRNLLSPGAHTPQHQALTHPSFPPQPQLLDQMPPQFPWGSHQ